MTSAVAAIAPGSSRIEMSRRTRCSKACAFMFWVVSSSRYWSGLNLPSTWNAGTSAMASRTTASVAAVPARSAACTSSSSSIMRSSIWRLTSGCSKYVGSKFSPIARRCCWRHSSKRWRNSSVVISVIADLGHVGLGLRGEVVVDAEERERNADRGRGSGRQPSRRSFRGVSGACRDCRGLRPAAARGSIREKQGRHTRAPFSVMAEWTGLEPATPGVTGRYSNRLNYHSAL